MNLSQAVKQYVTQMIKDSGAGMKVLVMDKETISVVSMVYSQSEILQKEVYLFELLANEGRESMKHLNAICFLRPTQENIECLSDELKSPKYNSYFVYFSNMLDRRALKTIAEADQLESVREMKEFYADYLAVGPHLFSLSQPVCCDPGMIWKREVYVRICDGLTSVLLALRKKPLIRYSHSSNVCKRLADELHRTVARERELFDFSQDVPPILLILDRRDDPITPLLNQWTYQAMVHELLGIKNHRVNLTGVAGIRDMQEVVLSPEHDEFFRENMYLNFGEIGANIKSLVETYQSKNKNREKLESIADMKAFIENYPEFKKLSGAVSKHVAVVGELSRIVSEHSLMGVSECEQDIVTSSDRNVFQTLEELMSDPKVRLTDSLRLGLLYCLRYEGSTKGDLTKVERLLISRGHTEEDKRTMKALLEHSGKAKRGGLELFESQGTLARTKKFFTKGLKGVENVYTRHKPLLVDTLEQLVRERLSETDYPYCGEFRLADKSVLIICIITLEPLNRGHSQ
jgi:vacuolar protein sorting-associated protein 45